jgi:hypothetical protein
MFNVWEWYREVDGDLVHQETIEVDHRVYTLRELKALVEESGWSYQTCYGGYDLGPLTYDSIRMMLVARKS